MKYSFILFLGLWIIYIGLVVIITISTFFIDTAHISDNQVTTAKINADAVTGAKIADDAVDSEHLAADSIDAEHYAPNSVDSTAIANDAVGADQLASDAVVNASVAAGAAIEFTKLENLDASKILVGNGSNKATEVSLTGDITINNAGVSAIGANTVEIGMLDCEQTTISDSDSHVPTSGAVVDYVA